MLHTIKDSFAVGEILDPIAISTNLYSGVSVIHKLGHAETVGTSVIDIWDGSNAYTYPTTASTMTISSVSVNDSSAGIGARTVQVYGLDTDYLEINEILSLNGQTPVTSVNSYLRVYRMIVRSAGSTGFNNGNIYIGTGTVTIGVPANVFAQILFDSALGHGENQTLMALYTIPAGKTGYLFRLFFSLNKTKECELWFYSRPLGEVFQVKYRSMMQTGMGEFLIPYPYKFEEKTDLTMRTVVSGGTTDLAAGFDLVLIDN